MDFRIVATVLLDLVVVAVDPGEVVDDLVGQVHVPVHDGLDRLLDHLGSQVAHVHGLVDQCFYVV